jgi:hypothetical protein
MVMTEEQKRIAKNKRWLLKREKEKEKEAIDCNIPELKKRLEEEKKKYNEYTEASKQPKQGIRRTIVSHSAVDKAQYALENCEKLKKKYLPLQVEKQGRMVIRQPNPPVEYKYPMTTEQKQVIGLVVDYIKSGKKLTQKAVLDELSNQIKLTGKMKDAVKDILRVYKEELKK